MGVGSKLDICSRHEVDYLSKVFGTVVLVGWTVVLVGSGGKRMLQNKQTEDLVK